MRSRVFKNTDGKVQPQGKETLHDSVSRTDSVSVTHRQCQCHSPTVSVSRTDSVSVTHRQCQCHAPTNTTTDKEKKGLYERLQAILPKAPDRDLKMVRRDLKANTGRSNKGKETTIATHELVDINENRALTAKVCTFRDLFVEAFSLTQKSA